MPVLSESEIARLLEPYLYGGEGAAATVPVDLYLKLSVYLDLLLRWNARTNLTAIRDAEQIVTRHFGESLLLTRLLPSDALRVLDFGSGAGFPGIPMQLLRPDLIMTLAESQGKKASFLREAVRLLGLASTVHGDRVERLPTGSRFDVVAMRAVDDMSLAIQMALRYSERLLLLTTVDDVDGMGLLAVKERSIPGSRERVAALCVPRGALSRM